MDKYNQDGLGTPGYPETVFQPLQDLLLRTLEGEGIHFEAIHIDRSFPEEGLPTRKPGIGMLGKYLDGSYDLKNSYVIGDRLTDIKLAENLGAQVIFIPNHEDYQEKLNQISCVANDWKQIYAFLKRKPRTVIHQRKTNETDISIALNLDGTGKSNISTGLGFFDHMLDQLARHGNFDLEINALGDLHIDEHHTVEDTAITLGEAFLKALGDKRGIERYGFLLPMDDCLAQVAVDFGGRNWLIWDAEFKREKIGEVSTELFFHFFKSFSDASRSNLNIKAEGDNEHHKIESIFKAFAKTLKMAVKIEPGNTQLPSTKGAL
jgi:imidazoleglycerol-phosphate dehydratase/histidinol-phosphatase